MSQYKLQSDGSFNIDLAKVSMVKDDFIDLDQFNVYDYDKDPKLYYANPENYVKKLSNDVVEIFILFLGKHVKDITELSLFTYRLDKNPLHSTYLKSIPQKFTITHEVIKEFGDWSNLTLHGKSMEFLSKIYKMRRAYISCHKMNFRSLKYDILGTKPSKVRIYANGIDLDDFMCNSVNQIQIKNQLLLANKFYVAVSTYHILINNIFYVDLVDRVLQVDSVDQHFDYTARLVSFSNQEIGLKKKFFDLKAMSIYNKVGELCKLALDIVEYFNGYKDNKIFKQIKDFTESDFVEKFFGKNIMIEKN